MRTLLLAGVLALTGFSMPAAADDTLAVGVFTANPPWQFRNAEGEFEGFEVDLVMEIGKRLSREIEFTGMDFKGLFSAVASGRADMAISSITITEERLQSLSFAQPYYDSDQALAVGAESEIAGTSDLAGKTVGVVSASTGDIWSRENRDELGLSDLRGYPGINEALLDLNAGRIDAFISDIPALQYIIATRGAPFQVIERIPTGEQYSILFGKNSDLLSVVNPVISEMKADGTLAAIHETWFGVAPDAGTSTIVEQPIPE